MNKRLCKKKKNEYKKYIAKTKAVINVNGEHITPRSKVDVYISKKFEGIDSYNEEGILNKTQNRLISLKKVKAKNFTHILAVKSNTPINLSVYVADINKSYYIIRPPR